MKDILRPVLAAVMVAVLVFSCGCGATAPAQDYTKSPEPVSVGSPYKFYFEQLEPIEQYAYNAVLSAIETFQTQIEVPVLTQEQLENFYLALVRDNPSLFFLGNNPTVRQTRKTAYFYPEYLMGMDDYQAMLHKCDVAAESICQQAQTQPTTFEQERIVHDLLVAKCRYSESDVSPYNNSIYGVLSTGAAACEGYAKTTKYIFDRLEIPCYVVCGNSTPPGANTQAHMWNSVLVDGQWYHLDLTWDDPVLEKGGDMIAYTYFNVTDSQIASTHSEYKSFYPCTATEQNYFVHEHLAFMDYGSAEKARTVEIAAQMLELGSDGFQLKFATQTALDKAKNVLFDHEGIYDLLSQIREASQVEFATDRVSYFFTDAEYTIEILVER